MSFLSDYEKFVYPFQPVISPAMAKDAIAEMDNSQEARAFIYSLTAATVNLARGSLEPEDQIARQMDYWVVAAFKQQAPLLAKEAITVRRIITIQLLHGCLMGLRRYDLAFYNLRQAATMIQLLRIGDASYTAGLEAAERARRQRLYYEIFVHERYMAISHHRDIILPPLPQLPEADNSIPYDVDFGFRRIVLLFLHVDANFITRWNESSESPLGIDSSWIGAKHKAIEDESAEEGREATELSDMQLADLVVTRHWLHMLLWQIAASQFLLSSGAEEQSMSLLYPIRVSARLRSTIIKLPKQIIALHGTAMLQKLFDITDTIGNVIVTVPATQPTDRTDRIRDFCFLLDFLFGLPRLHEGHKAILEEKLNAMRSLYPRELDEFHSAASAGAWIPT